LALVAVNPSIHCLTASAVTCWSTRLCHCRGHEQLTVLGLYRSRPERLPLAWRNQRTVLGLALHLGGAHGKYPRLLEYRKKLSAGRFLRHKKGCLSWPSGT